MAVFCTCPTQNLLGDKLESYRLRAIMEIPRQQVLTEHGKRANVAFQEKKVQGRLNEFQKKKASY